MKPLRVVSEQAITDALTVWRNDYLWDRHKPFWDKWLPKRILGLLLLAALAYLISSFTLPASVPAFKPLMMSVLTFGALSTILYGLRYRKMIRSRWYREKKLELLTATISDLKRRIDEEKDIADKAYLVKMQSLAESMRSVLLGKHPPADLLRFVKNDVPEEVPSPAEEDPHLAQHAVR